MRRFSSIWFDLYAKVATMKKFLVFCLLLSSSPLLSQMKYEVVCDNLLILKSREIAKKQVGVTEKTNKNDGIEVERYLKSVGLPKGYPYCAAGQYYCWKEATSFYVNQYQNPVPKTASANGMFDGLAKKGTRTAYRPQVNDLLVWKNAHNYNGHIERVDSVYPKGWVLTIGFNTASGNKGNQRDGGGVYYRLRNPNHFLGRMQVRGLIGFKPRKQN